MAQRVHLDLIEQGSEVWNQWRRDNPDVRPDLYAAHLPNADLSGMNLSAAILAVAVLYRADLSGADLRGADVSSANLMEATLRRANLHGADLAGADLQVDAVEDLDRPHPGAKPLDAQHPLGAHRSTTTWSPSRRTS